MTDAHVRLRALTARMRGRKLAACRVVKGRTRREACTHRGTRLPFRVHTRSRMPIAPTRTCVLKHAHRCGGTHLRPNVLQRPRALTGALHCFCALSCTLVSTAYVWVWCICCVEQDALTAHVGTLRFPQGVRAGESQPHSHPPGPVLWAAPTAASAVLRGYRCAPVLVPTPLQRRAPPGSSTQLLLGGGGCFHLCLPLCLACCTCAAPCTLLMHGTPHPAFVQCPACMAPCACATLMYLYTHVCNLTACEVL